MCGWLPTEVIISIVALLESCILSYFLESKYKIICFLTPKLGCLCQEEVTNIS